MAGNVRIAGYHCFNDWHMELVGYKADYPVVERVTVKVPGRDGEIDITENLYGRTIYGNRKITLQLENHEVEIGDSFAEFETKILSEVHGVRGQIIFDDDPGFYFIGLIKVKALNDNDGIWEMEIEVDADPYKYLISDPTQKSL